MAFRLQRPAARFVAMVAACVLMAWVAAAHATPSISLVLSDHSPLYAEVARALRTELEADRRGWQVRVQSWNERDTSEREDLIVPIGLRALQSVLGERGNTPVWSLLVPRPSFERLVAESPAGRSRPLSALYLDQPLSRQMQMLRAALPRARQVGILLGPGSSERADALKAAAEIAQLRVVSARIDTIADLIPTLNSLRNEIDVLLLLPDPLLTNRASLQALLLQTYQLTLPVAAYSAQLIEAGATLALFATPAQIGAEAGVRLRQARSGTSVTLPATDHPDSFEVAVNRSVAVSLDLRLPTGELLRQRMTRGSGQ